MPDIQKLKELSVDDLLQELRAREAKAGKAARAVPLEPSENLREFDDASIAKALKENQKVIYGTDDRVDVFQLPPGPNLNDVDSVVALFDAADVTDNGNGTSTLQTQNFGTARNLCAGERFRDQPIGAFCSGFLVATDIIATAGHCVNTGNVTNVRLVFGFRMRNATTAETVINNAEIYRGVNVIGRQEVGNGPDWALVRIDRPVTNHRIVRIRQVGRIGDTQAVHVIGHPSGLPIKFAGGAAVRSNQPNAFFVANLDTYGGNSGSPVFNSDTHEVEGILVRGEADFVQQGNCRVSLVCPTTGCRGEDCTRTKEFSDVLNPPNLLFNDGEVLRWLGSPDQWERIGNDARIVSMAAAGSALYLHFNDGKVLRWLGSPDQWERIGNDARIVSMAAAGSALYLHFNDGKVLRWLGSPDQWERIGNDARIVSMAAAGSALYLHFNDGEVLRWLGSPDQWERIGNDARIVSMAAAGSALYLHFNDGKVLRWLGSPDQWERIGNDARIVSMAAAGSALYLHFNDGEVLRWLGSPDQWERIGNDARIVSMAAAGSALYLHFNDGKVLRWLGSPDQWERIGNDARIVVISV